MPREFHHEFAQQTDILVSEGSPLQNPGISSSIDASGDIHPRVSKVPRQGRFSFRDIAKIFVVPRRTSTGIDIRPENTLPPCIFPRGRGNFNGEPTDSPRHPRRHPVQLICFDVQSPLTRMHLLFPLLLFDGEQLIRETRLGTSCDDTGSRSLIYLTASNRTTLERTRFKLPPVYILSPCTRRHSALLASRRGSPRVLWG